MNSPKIYNVKDYGARSNDWLQTDAIQAAIDDCFKNGGGKVVIPQGIYRTATIRIRSNVNLHLESGAVLRGSTNPEDYFNYLNDTVEPIPTPLTEEERKERNLNASVYPFSRWNNAIIRVIDAHDVSITGEPGSYINGMNVYDAIGEENYRGPHAINVQNCENLYLEGYSVVDSANWGHAIFNSKNITCRNVRMYAGHDGFDVRSCDNILIEDCEFTIGDDCIAGFDNNDVIIRRCYLNSACAALRFGGNNVLIEDCKSAGPANYAHRYTLSAEDKARSAQTTPKERHSMCTFFLYYCDFRADIRRTPGNIVIRNCTVENPDIFFSHKFDGEHPWCSNRPLSSIRFENCSISGVKKPALLFCDKDDDRLTLELENVSISPREGFENAYVMDGVNFDRISMKNVTITGYTDPTILTHGFGEVIGGEGIKVVHDGDGIPSGYSSRYEQL